MSGRGRGLDMTRPAWMTGKRSVGEVWKLLLMDEGCWDGMWGRSPQT